MPSFYSIVVPVGDRRNLVPNPSFEVGTAGWGTVTGGTFGTTSNTQQFGAWAGSFAPSSNGTAGIYGPLMEVGVGTDYTYSVYANIPAGVPYLFGVAGIAGVGIFPGSVSITGGGTWHRYVGSHTEASSVLRSLVLKKRSSADTQVVYVDAFQMEAGSLTTYIDGDQGPGYYWDGPPHVSPSARTAGVRTGGTVYELWSLGFLILEHAGVGMPDVEVITQDYAAVPGAFYQRTHVPQRSFLLTGLMSGTTFPDLAAIRSRVIQTIKPDGVPTPQPFRILYTGGNGSVQIDAVYDSGMQLQSPEGFSETAAMRFVSVDPFWESITEQGTSLAPFVTFGSANYLMKRDANWTWGTLGINGTTTNGMIKSLAYRSGTLFVGGGFTTIGGTASGRLAILASSGAVANTATFGTLGGTVGGGTVNAIALLANGTVVFGGDWTLISGLSNTRFIGQWSSAGFGTITGGTTNGTITGLAQVFGALFIGGSFSYGASNRHVTSWDAGYVGLSATVDQPVTMLAAAQSGQLYVGFNGGIVGTALATGGARYWGIGRYSAGGSTWGTMGLGVRKAADPARADAAVVAPSQIAYVGGAYDSAGGGSAGNVAAFANPSWNAFGGDISAQFPDSNPTVTALAIDPVNGAIYAAGIRAELQINLGGAGGTWGNIGFFDDEINALLFTPDRSLYVAKTTAGAGTFAASTKVINAGNARTSLRLRITAPDNRAVSITHAYNPTNEKGVFFGGYAPQIAAGDIATLDTSPGSVSYTSYLRGNRMADILPGSDPANFQLEGGTNYVNIYATPGTARIDLIWRPRFWSNDG